MKILSFGRITPQIVNCTRCHATLQVTENDLHETYGPFAYTISCPVCGWWFNSEEGGYVLSENQEERKKNYELLRRYEKTHKSY